MARLLRPNTRLEGVSTSPTGGAVGATNGQRRGYGLGRVHPVGSAGLIIPQVIEWPWATDDAGVAFPSGIVGLRTVNAARNTERAWATPGDPLEGQDKWIAVPTTLPSGYTARTGRDSNKGTYGVASGFPSVRFSRGAPWLDIAWNGAGVGATASWNYEAIGGAGAYVMKADFTINGNDPRSTAISMPSYRPSGGGGVVPLDWFPVNLSQKTLDCIWYEGGGYDTLHPDFDAWFRSGLIFPTSGMAVWTRYGPGIRAVTMRTTFIGLPSDWTAMPNAQIGVQFMIKHNADGSRSGKGDTLDYLSPLYRKSDVTATGIYIGGYQIYSIIHTATIASQPTAADGFRSWCVGCQVGQVNSLLYSVSAYTSGGDQNASNRVWLSPRVDVPPWFTATGAGLIAPGGI